MNPDESTQDNQIGGETNSDTQIQSFDKYSGLAENERKMRRQARFAENLKNPAGKAYMNKVANRYLRNTKKGQALLSKGSKPQNPISTADLVLLLSVASFFDFWSFVLAFLDTGFTTDILCTLPASLIFGYMYKKRGIDIKSPKFLGKYFGTLAMEFIPIINALPSFIAQVLLVAGASKAKEVTGIDFE